MQIMDLSLLYVLVHLNIEPGASDISAVAMFMTFQYSNLWLFIIEIFILYFLNVIQYYQGLLVHQISSREPVLVKLCTIQDRLAYVTATIEKAYGLPLLFMVLSSFCFINVNMFLAAKGINNRTVIIIIAWIIIVFILIFRISLICERIKEEVSIHNYKL